jgi:hypothetical protein
MRRSALVLLLAVTGCASSTTPDDPAGTTTVPAPAYDCVASITDLTSGRSAEVPAPCHDPANGVCVRTDGTVDTFRAWAEPCSVVTGCDNGQITVRIENNGWSTTCDNLLAFEH